MSENAPRLLIVIPCLNEERHLAKVLDSLLGDGFLTRQRIVVADGGSADRTIEIAKEYGRRFPAVTLLHNEKKLQAAAVNLAVAAFGDDADILIRIDAHADYPDHYCLALVTEAVKTQADSVVTAMRTVGITGFQKAVAAAQNSKLGNGGSAHRVADNQGKWVDHGHHALMRIPAFRAVGGYDESFSHNEDAELDFRLRKAGYKIWLTAETTLTYYPRTAPLSLFRQYKGYGSGRARTLMKHGARPKLRQLLPIAVAPAALFSLVTPWFTPACIPLLLWMTPCLAYGLMLGVRARDTAVALSGPAALIMHAAWSFGFLKSVLFAPRKTA